LEYRATKEACSSILEGIEIKKVPGRMEIFTIDMSHTMIDGTDLPTLFRDGTAQMDAYVNSSFVTLPIKTVVFRTDKNQESVDSLTVAEVEAMLLPVMQLDGSLFVNSPENTTLTDEDDPNSV